MIRIQPAKFIEHVASYVGDRSADEVIQELNERHQNYRLVEQDLSQRRVRLMGKLPEIEKAVAAVAMLLERREAGEDAKVDFQLSEQLYARARVRQPESVALWLGADVMLEFPLQEAAALLAKNLSNAKAQLASVLKDLELIKDFITTTEVSIARVYNFDLARRKRP
ncbi:hypothetical protein WJX81_000596 [Elliptochloris bilobata]|uniref:Prefoldin subunit 3 n=1 Tax=Elliptochloris bilobata TaxID=381761 RepID=A0AAW1S6D1_9CHLO